MDLRNKNVANRYVQSRTRVNGKLHTTITRFGQGYYGNYRFWLLFPTNRFLYFVKKKRYG